MDPEVCALSVSESWPKRLTIALEVLIEHEWLTGLQAERAGRYYAHVCSTSSPLERMRDFDRKEQRLETLWLELRPSAHKELLLFVNIILCLSHGNSSVEHGFSVNKECLVENTKEESLIAHRLVYYEVSAKGGVAKLDITYKMVDMVHGANIRWKEDFKRNKQEQLDPSDVDRKRAAALVKELELKRQKVIKDAQVEASLLQEEFESLKK